MRSNSIKLHQTCTFRGWKIPLKQWEKVVAENHDIFTAPRASYNLQNLNSVQTRMTSNQAPTIKITSSESTLKWEI